MMADVIENIFIKLLLFIQTDKLYTWKLVRTRIYSLDIPRSRIISTYLLYWNIDFSISTSRITNWRNCCHRMEARRRRDLAPEKIRRDKRFDQVIGLPCPCHESIEGIAAGSSTSWRAVKVRG